MIYTPAEFGGVAGQITSVSFYVNSLNVPGDMVNTRIYMKTRPNFFSLLQQEGNVPPSNPSVKGKLVIAGEASTCTLVENASTPEQVSCLR